MIKQLVIIGICIIPLNGFTQGLFEQAIQGSEDREDVSISVDWGGYIRGTSFVGESSFTDQAVFQSVFGEVSLNLKAKKNGLGTAFMESRLRSGYEYGQDTLQFDLREVWGELYLGKLDFRIGKQIVSWGRGDGFNPTNNITPKNYFVRSPELDDRNLGNFLLKGGYAMSSSLRLDIFWVPVYKPSIYRFDQFESGEHIKYTSGHYPVANFENGSYAIKLDWQVKGLDGSVSYFNGYDPLPGINVHNISINPDLSYQAELRSEAYAEQIIGGDFSAIAGSFGLRGEMAFRLTDGYAEEVFIPNPDVRYVIGIDRTLGEFSVILQYIGQHVFDFIPVIETHDLLQDDLLPGNVSPDMIETLIREGFYNEIERYNRAINNQTVEWGHGVSVNLTRHLFYETLSLDLGSYYNFSTEETLISPKVSYDVSDGINLAIGGQYFWGPDGTNFELIAPVLNGGFLELRYSF